MQIDRRKFLEIAIPTSAALTGIGLAEYGLKPALKPLKEEIGYKEGELDQNSNGEIELKNWHSPYKRKSQTVKPGVENKLAKVNQEVQNILIPLLREAGIPVTVSSGSVGVFFYNAVTSIERAEKQLVEFCEKVSASLTKLQTALNTDTGINVNHRNRILEDLLNVQKNNQADKAPISANKLWLGLGCTGIAALIETLGFGTLLVSKDPRKGYNKEAMNLLTEFGTGVLTSAGIINLASRILPKYLYMKTQSAEIKALAELTLRAPNISHDTETAAKALLAIGNGNISFSPETKEPQEAKLTRADLSRIVEERRRAFAKPA